MKFKILLVILGLSWTVNLVAQEYGEGLVTELWNTSQPDTILAKMLKTRLYSDSLNEVFAKEAIAFSVKNGLNDWEVSFLLKRANFDIKNGEEIKGITSALAIVERIKQGELKAKRNLANALLYVSVGFQNLGAYQEAIKYRKLHLKKTHLAKHQLRYVNSNNAIGKMYLQLGQYDSAKVFYIKSLFRTRELSQRKREASANNDLGLVLFEEENYDSAEVYFENSLLQFSKGTSTIDSVMVGVVGGNLAKCLPIKEKQEIERLLKLNIKRTKKYGYTKSLANAYFDFGNLYFETLQFKKSQRFLDSALQVNLSMPPSVVVGENRVDIYEAYMQIFEKTHEPRQSLKYADLLLQLNDSLYGKDVSRKNAKMLSNIKVNSIQNELLFERLKLSTSLEKIKVFETEEKLARIKLVLVGSFGVSGILVILFILYKFNSEQKKKTELDVLSKKMLEASNEFKTQRLTQSALGLQRKSEFAKEIIQKVSEMEGVSTKSLSDVKVFINNEIQMDGSLLEMEKYVAELSKEFFEKLKQAYPNLTPNDVKLCGLIALNLSLKEIAIIRNITPNSVKIAKNRLSKKMNLAPGTPLFQFLNDFGAKG